MKISLITVTYNAAHTIERCIKSVVAQTYPNLEYIVIDGHSADHTAHIISKYKSSINKFISEPDNGIYDAMNKGIALATGDVIGMLNADDFFADEHVLADVAQAFEISTANIIYGDINFVNKQDKVIRKWRSGSYQHGDFNWGWMPPHPSFYAKRELFHQYGVYNPNYGTAADYELMIRFIHTHKINIYYINKVLVNMLIGGVSTKNINNRVKAWQNDFKAMQRNGLSFPLISIMLKPLRKITQYIK